MISSLHELSVWQLLAKTDFVSGIIITFLFLLSVANGAIVLFKFFSFRSLIKRSLVMAQRLEAIKSLRELVAIEGSSAVDSFTLMLSRKLSAMTPFDKERCEYMAGQELESFLSEQERGIPFLNTTAQIAPLIGLLGTVWGLINAFVSIGQQKAADIVVVAPGIAQALLTTFVGLIVAIPALAFFHYFSNRLRIVELQMDTVVQLVIYSAVM